MLELDTKTLQIQDADGLSRFKTGFFVDDFKNTNLIDVDDIDCNITVDTEANELIAPVNFWSVKPEIALDPTININWGIEKPILSSQDKKLNFYKDLLMNNLLPR